LCLLFYIKKQKSFVLAYDIDFVKKGGLLLHKRPFLLYPEFWEDSTVQLPSYITWQSVQFNQLNHALVSLHRGVYCFVVQPVVKGFFETRYLFYLGKTNRTLRKRYSEYLDNQQGKGKPRSKVYEMLKLYKDYLHFYYAELNTEKEVDEVEEKLLNTFVPHINTQIPNAKISPELKDIYLL